MEATDKATISPQSALVNHLDGQKNLNRWTMTNKRTGLRTCDLLKHLLVLFEMLPCENEPNQEENATL